MTLPALPDFLLRQDRPKAEPPHPWLAFYRRCKRLFYRPWETVHPNVVTLSNHRGVKLTMGVQGDGKVLTFRLAPSSTPLSPAYEMGDHGWDVDSFPIG